jgi:hypothetical protein
MAERQHAFPDASRTADMSFPVVYKYEDYTLTVNDFNVLVDTSREAVPVVLSLPAASSCKGKIFNVVAQRMSERIFLCAEVNECINGLSTYVFKKEGDSLTVQSDGNNWIII